MEASPNRRVLHAALADQRRHRLRAFIYARVSRDPRKRNTSVRDQQTENHRTCADNNWDVAGEFADPDRSASRHAKRSRPDWNEMMARSEAGECDVIVFWEAARGYRDLEVFVQLRRICLQNGILLCYDGDVYDLSKRSDWKRLTRDAVDAEDEAEKIRERILRTTRLSAERGAIHGKIPYGFRREYDPRTGDLLWQIEDDATAAVLKEAAKRVAAGQTTYSIAKDFQKRGIPAPRNAKRGWDPQTINQIVLNPAVVGKRVHRGRIVGDAVWKPILEVPLYNACKLILGNPARRTQRDSAIVHLLSGIAKCHCGSVLRPRHNREQLAYTCTGGFCTSMEVRKLERFVELAVLKYMERPEFARALEPDDRDDVVAKAATAIAGYQAEIDEAQELFRARKLSVGGLSLVESELLPLIEAENQRMMQSSAPPVLVSLASGDVREVWAAMDLPQRRAALRLLVGVTLNPARAKGVRVIEPGRVGLAWKY